MLIINPKNCIDCGVCVAECPVDAIKPESDKLLIWVERAQRFSLTLPKIVRRKNPPSDAELYKDEVNKFEKYIKE